MSDDINEVQSGKTLIWNPLYEDSIFSFLENIDYSECIEDGLKNFSCKPIANVVKQYNDRVTEK